MSEPTLFANVDLYELERALIDAICERNGIERCTLPHCDCARMAETVVRKIRQNLESAGRAALEQGGQS